MTNRDFDQDDARELAEFAGFEETSDINKAEVWGLPDGTRPKNGLCWKYNWKPWKIESPQWQIQSLKNAVREKGLEEEFDFELSHMIYEGGDQLTAIDYASALPSAVCEAILEMEVEE